MLVGLQALSALLQPYGPTPYGPPGQAQPSLHALRAMSAP